MINEILEGVLVDAIAATGRRLGAAMLAASGRSGNDDLAVARWFDTYRLSGAPPELSGVSSAMAGQLAACLQGNGIQAVLHELLAARLTDAPESDVERICTLFGSTLIADGKELAPLAMDLFDYYDGQIAELVGRLEGSEPSLLQQIRDESFAARMVAILHAIERHTASLSAQPEQRSRDNFLAGYRRHVMEQHGQLEPPDFERRRRIPINDLYVSPRITPMVDAGPIKQPADADLNEVDLVAFADKIDRSVLLGDPGGGKTTAANVLMNHYASDTRRKVPFLVTLREFAAAVPPERSVSGHIEHRLETFYQCPAPAGLVSHLLITGAVVVIFDGLDELLDATHRLEVTAIVERFCTEYPLVAVMVTSRMVGYDQARLDNRHFLRYRIDGFTQDQVGEYVRRWFAQEEEVRTEESADWGDTFMQESASVPDLRTNPLMLALMCILYRGEGSLPRSRAEIYERCASLLFRKWDARRRIYLGLRAAHLLEPALRHLAWWLLTRDQIQPAVTERELIGEATTFMHERGFESESKAKEAATEFVEFCRGRLWVFSDTGTTATGDILYSFTHRTFLEYFSAAQLAYRCDTPRDLAVTLAPHIARQEWDVVGELALQIKDHTSDRGADRIYTLLLRERRHRAVKGRRLILQYLARSLRSVDPSPATVRELTEIVLNHLFAGPANDPLRYLPLSWLIASSAMCAAVVNDEIGKRIASMVESLDPETHLDGLRLAVWLRNATLGIENYRPERNSLYEFWEERTREYAQLYASSITAAANSCLEMRTAAHMLSLVTTAQELEMPGAILPLVQTQSTGIFRIRWASHLVSSVVTLALGSWDSFDKEFRATLLSNFTTVGQFLLRKPELPWVSGRVQPWSEYLGWHEDQEVRGPSPSLDPVTYLGAAAVLLAATESIETRLLPAGGPERFGPLCDVAYYILYRWSQWDGVLPDLTIPPNFKDSFRDWAEGKIDFSRPTGT